MPSTASFALNSVDAVLNTILNSRLQRKAKSIILSCVEFLVVDLAILLTYLKYEIENASVEFFLRVTLYAGAAYGAILALFLFVHASCFVGKVDNQQTSLRIENAYARTNKLPFVDGVLELPFPFIYKGDFWYLPYLTWSICAGLTSFSVFLLYSVRDQLDMVAYSTLGAGALLLYQITSDFSEYWVHSRHRQSSAVGNSKEDGVNEEADVSITVGERNVSSAGFTRL